jgi:hypothetical protein
LENGSCGNERYGEEVEREDQDTDEAQRFLVLASSESVYARTYRLSVLHDGCYGVDRYNTPSIAASSSMQNMETTLYVIRGPLAKSSGCPSCESFLLIICKRMLVSGIVAAVADSRIGEPQVL